MPQAITQPLTGALPAARSCAAAGARRAARRPSADAPPPIPDANPTVVFDAGDFATGAPSVRAPASGEAAAHQRKTISPAASAASAARDRAASAMVNPADHGHAGHADPRGAGNRDRHRRARLCPRGGQPGRAQLRRHAACWSRARSRLIGQYQSGPAGRAEARLCDLDAADPARRRLGQPRLARDRLRRRRPGLPARSTPISSSGSARRCCCR